MQGVKEKELSDALDRKLDAQRQMIRDRKIQLKKEAKQLDIELGFVDPSAEKVRSKVPEWKKQKNFLNAVFPPPVICRKYNNVMVYRNKLSMQEYWHRVVTPEEWDANMELLNEMRAIYDQENPEQQGLCADDEEEQQSGAQEEGEAANEEDGGDGEEEDEGEQESGDDEGEGGNESEENSGAVVRAAVSIGAIVEEEEEEEEVEQEEEGSEGEAAGSDGEGEGEGEDGESGDEEGEGSDVESESESVDETGVAKLSVA